MNRLGKDRFPAYYKINVLLLLMSEIVLNLIPCNKVVRMVASINLLIGLLLLISDAISQTFRDYMPSIHDEALFEIDSRSAIWILLNDRIIPLAPASH